MNLEDTKSDWKPVKENEIKYVVDPNRDYMADVDDTVPPWFAEPYKTSEMVATGAALTPCEDGEVFRDVPRTVERKRNQYAVSHIRYERALDPNGFICAVNTSTTRPGPGHEDGDDGIGTATRVRSEKMQQGWLWLEPGWSHRGRVGDDYLAWVFAVKEQRQKMHEKRQAEEAEEFLSQAAQMLKKQMSLQVASNEDLAMRIAKIVAESKIAHAAEKVCGKEARVE